MLQLYKSLVRPKLELVLHSGLETVPKKDINVLERVQLRRATRMITGYSKLNYEERLASLGPTTLETRRLRGDLIEAFKISKGYDTGSEIFFSKNVSNLRGHSMKVTKKNFKLDVRKFSFSNRVINEWNGLSEEIIQSKSLAGFKKRIDYHLGYIR